MPKRGSEIILEVLDRVGSVQEAWSDLDNALSELYSNAFFSNSGQFLDTNKKTSKLADKQMNDCFDALENIDESIDEFVALLGRLQ